MTLTELIKARVEEFDNNWKQEPIRDFLIASMQQVADAALGEVPEKKGNSKKLGLRGEENKNAWNFLRSRLLRWAGKE